MGGETGQFHATQPTGGLIHTEVLAQIGPRG